MPELPRIIYGLIGYPLGHSFSANYFDEKFKKMAIKAEYRLFPLEDISFLPALIKSFDLLLGFNVTIPFKESVIRYLDDLSEDAAEIGAVNVVKLQISCQTGTSLKGFNTDWLAFSKSVKSFIPDNLPGALILGTGGSSKAVAYALAKMNMKYVKVSRNPKIDCFVYEQITGELLKEYPLIINTTPCGMHPDVENAPPFPVHYLGSDSYVFDLVYNPGKSLLLKKSEENGARIKNGLEMLHLQADLSYDIWKR